MTRLVVKPLGSAAPSGAGLTDVEPLENTGLYLGTASDTGPVVDSSELAWAAPVIEDAGAESYPTGELSIRFAPSFGPDEIASFAKRHALEVRRRNELIPEQVVVAPVEPRGAWLPDLVESLNGDAAVRRAWPNTLSRYRRA